MDEIVGFHEMMNRPMRLMFKPGGLFTYAWVLIGIPLVGFLGFFYTRFFFNLPRKMQIRTAIAAILYVGGALGFEMVCARHFALYDDENIPYILLANIEETLEIAGGLVFVYALLDYILSFYQGIQIKITQPDTNPGP